ncbi:MAG: hypothetical protein M3Q03_06800 [Chloroflexota bacterium]|nr:hypothetical protein [Chloroflexota bacterium]
MKYLNRWQVAVAVLIIAGLGVWGLSRQSDDVGSASAALEEPAHVELIEGTDLHRVILSQKAAKRLDIQTAGVRDEQIGETLRRVIPYGAVIYHSDGSTWTYTNPEPLVFVRHAITVEAIRGDDAVLTDGPPADTAVVAVGAAELYGTEYGVGH